MTARPILELPDARLRDVAIDTERFSGDVDAAINDLKKAFASTHGIGLSAPQIGIGLRALVTDLSPDRSEPRVFCDPVITHRARTAIVEESCLSVPGISARVMRATRIRVRALDESGAAFETDLEDMAAVALQHEVDHLDGVLFIDRVSSLERWWLKARRRLPSEWLQPAVPA